MKLYYIIVSSRTAVKENRFSGLFLPEKHDKLIKKRETRTSRMRISRLLVCLCLLALLCACAAPALPNSAMAAKVLANFIVDLPVMNAGPEPPPRRLPYRQGLNYNHSHYDARLCVPARPRPRRERAV